MCAIVRICNHREISCHIDAGDKDGFDIVTMSCVTSEGHPGVIMAFRVFFKGGFEFDVFSICAVLGDQGCTLFLGKLKRETGTGFQEPWGTMRDVVRAELDGPYGVVQTEAPRLAPVSLTVLVQR